MWIRANTLLWMCAIAVAVGVVTLNFKLAGFGVLDAAVVLAYVWVRGQIRPRTKQAVATFRNRTPADHVQSHEHIERPATHADVLAQAQRIMAEQARCSMDIALDNLTKLAADNRCSLDDYAALVVQGRLRFY